MQTSQVAQQWEDVRIDKDSKQEITENIPNYQQVAPNEADAWGWAFITPEKIEKYHFKFYPLQPYEIRAKVLYCGLCHSDTLMAKGAWFTDLVYPLIAGHEIIAEVEELGSEVKDFQKGEKVGFGFQRDCCDQCQYCKTNKETLCTEVKDKPIFGRYFGGFATKIQQPAKFYYKLPIGLDLKKAPSLLCAGITVFTPIKWYAKKGDRCAVLGVGGLGHMAVQFLAKQGFDVTAFNNVKEYDELITSLGAKEVVDITNTEQLKSHQGKYDFIINTLPVAERFESLIMLAAPRCRFIQVGLPASSDYLKVPAIPLVFNEIELIGSFVGNRIDMTDMLQQCANDYIYPISEFYNFEDFNKAIETIEKGHPKFRIVLDLTNN
jgi:D-arabinose 1-dehydrogenase-like Zn-dependent alcohol dehydrogenase